jgi:8-oxo-dGTP pyrophosphatase MutT (NUDIX family)
LSKRRQRRIQYAALPFRPGPRGVEVLLITSRETRRWVIPKGWPMKERTAPQTAAQEAFEEAGIEGLIAEQAVGTYRYDKRLKSGKSREVEVEVFPLRVTEVGDDWPEREQRSREWFSPAVAAALVMEPELKALLAAFGRVRLDGDGAEGVEPTP